MKGINLSTVKILSVLTLGKKKGENCCWKITWTVFLILCDGPGYSGEYRSVRNREFMSVDFPSPDSPERQRQSQSEWVRGWEWTPEMHFTLYLFPNPLFHARLRRNMTWSPDVCQLPLRCRDPCLTFLTCFRFKTFFQNRKRLPLTPFLKQASVNMRRRTRQTGWKFCPPKFFSCLHFRNLIKESWEGRRGEEDFQPPQSSWTFTKIPLHSTQRNLRQQKQRDNRYFLFLVQATVQERYLSYHRLYKDF